MVKLAFVTPDGYAFTIDARSYPGRQPEEPDTEKVIRGSRDGFTENIIQNTALVRRRLRTEKLRYEMHKTTVNGKTDVVIAYMDGAASKKHLTYIRERLDEIHHDGLTMTDKSARRISFQARFSSDAICSLHRTTRYMCSTFIGRAYRNYGRYVTFRYSCSDDIFHHLQHAEEYRQAPLIGTFVRIIRFTGAVLSLFLFPFWYLLATKQTVFPDILSYIGPKEIGEVPLFVQLLMADVGIEVLRMAAIHTPTPMSTAMGLVAAIVIGQVAIDVGLFTARSRSLCSG